MLPLFLLPLLRSADACAGLFAGGLSIPGLTAPSYAPAPYIPPASPILPVAPPAAPVAPPAAFQLPQPLPQSPISLPSFPQGPIAGGQLTGGFDQNGGLSGFNPNGQVGATAQLQTGFPGQIAPSPQAPFNPMSNLMFQPTAQQALQGSIQQGPQLPQSLPLPFSNSLPQPEFVNPSTSTQPELKDWCYSNSENGPAGTNPNCFINTRGFQCCQRELNEFLEDLAATTTYQTRWRGCNQQRMVTDIQKSSEERFNLQFEAIVGGDNVCGRNQFFGNWICKTRLVDGKVILIYAHPSANNFTMQTSQYATNDGRYVQPLFNV